MTDSDTPCGEAAVGASTAEEVGADEEGEDADEVDVVAAGGEDAVVVQNKQNDCRKMNKEHGIMIGEKQEMAGRILSDPTLFRPFLVTMQHSLSFGADILSRLPSNAVASDFYLTLLNKMGRKMNNLVHLVESAITLSGLLSSREFLLGYNPNPKPKSEELDSVVFAGIALEYSALPLILQ